MRNLVLVLGDQLDLQSTAFDGFDSTMDIVWMAEVAEESTKVWTSKIRIALFLSAMRHFRAALHDRQWTVTYRELIDTVADPTKSDSLASALAQSIDQLRPTRIILVEPGEWRVRREILDVLTASGVPWEMREDRHFLCSREEFSKHAQGRKQLRMEYFYREMRRKHHVLINHDAPEGGAWNFDSENRKTFGKHGPPLHRAPLRFPPDALTRAMIDLVNVRFADHPGDLQAFDWPVTAEQAEQALRDFITYRLSEFGDWQDALWTAEPWLFHSRLSAAMNLKLLNPRIVITAAEDAYKAGHAPLAAVEGFIRQILGWREYVRGIYWHHMPNYATLNELGAEQPLPPFYWTGNTEMACLNDALGQTLRYGYAHHIQRLMVTGLYALLLGVRPHAVHEWYLAVYVDAVEWVELPNTLGMSQYADGGIMASKPYAASGKYIQRMSNYCTGCPYDPAQSTGLKACPFTTLYWDFLLQHEVRLRKNPRTAMQVRSIDRLSSEQRQAIQAQAEQIRKNTSINTVNK
jgi:deoxyribodipyrimidine photolyase-related protein